MRVKNRLNFNKILKKYWLWLILAVAVLIIPATN